MNNDVQEKMRNQTRAVFEIDLEPIKFKLMDKEEGPGWTREQADRCALEYQRFLALAARHRGEGIVPSRDVDKFWHMHILDTRKYMDDCSRALGFFLHHSPHYGPRRTADAKKVGAAFARTRRLYANMFGVSPEPKAAWCAVADGKAEQKAAWCAVADGKAEQKAAWCAVADGKAEQKAAWCAVADDQAEQKAAWCAVADGKADRPGLPASRISPSHAH